MSLYQKLLSEIDGEKPIESVVIGSHLTAVECGDGLGLATTLRADGPAHTRPEVRQAGDLANKSLAELAGLIDSDLPMERSVGMAAINAGLPVAGLDLTDKNGFELLKERCTGKRLCVVGHFSFVDKLRKIASECDVLELEPRDGDLPARDAGRVMPKADVVAITGSAFVNRTIEPILDMARDKWTMVLGPSTPLTPLLFEFGVDVVAGALASDIDRTRSQVGQGAIFKQLDGVRRVLIAR